MLKCAAFLANIDFDIDFVFTEKTSCCFLNKVIIIKTIITRIDNDNNNDNNFNNNSFPVTLKHLGWHSTRNGHVSWAGEALLSLGWQSLRDGVSKAILVVMQPKNH